MKRGLAIEPGAGGKEGAKDDGQSAETGEEEAKKND